MPKPSPFLSRLSVDSLFREASLGHQLLLALGRVVSTKVYLSSRGVEETVRQNAKTWRQRFLQSGIQGTGIVFSNGSLDEAMKTPMSSFPPSAQEMQDTFVAVFTGPEQPTVDEQAAIDGEDADAEQRREEMARGRMQREVGLCNLMSLRISSLYLFANSLNAFPWVMHTRTLLQPAAFIA